jgi:hypothetical protein
LTLACGFEGSTRSKKRELSFEKWASDYTAPITSPRKRGLGVIRRWLKRVIEGQFIESFSGVDELGYWWRCLKVRDTLRFHDVFN